MMGGWTTTERPRLDSNPQPSVYEWLECWFVGDPGIPVNCHLIHPNVLVCTRMNRVWLCIRARACKVYDCVRVWKCPSLRPVSVCDRGSFYCSHLVTHVPVDTHTGTRRTHVTNITSRPGRERGGWDAEIRGREWRENGEGVSWLSLPVSNSAPPLPPPTSYCLLEA